MAVVHPHPESSLYLGDAAKSLFITLEGGEGCGKTTQAGLFHSWFSKKYGRAVETREPGGEPVAEKIRDVLLDRSNNIRDYAELFLYFAARDQFLNGIVRPNLEEGKSVIADRFSDSTTAYQGYGRKIDLNYIDFIQRRIIGKTIPDITFIIDVDPEVGLINAKNRGHLSRIDAEDLEFHTRVNNGFRKIARDNLSRCVLIPYQEGIDNVQLKMREEFSRKYL